MASDEPMPDRCGARAKSQPGKFCTSRRVPGRTRCRMHGGLTPRGPALPQFKTGRYSKYLGGALGEAYKHSLANPELLDLKDSVAMLDAIAQRAAERATEFDTPRFRERAIELFDEAQAQLAAGDTASASKTLQDLGRHLKRGDHEDRALRYLSDSIERYSRRAEEATRLSLAKHAAIPASDLIILFARLTEAITRSAPRDVAVTILTECDKLLAPLTGGGPQTQGDYQQARAVEAAEADVKSRGGGKGGKGRAGKG